MSPTAMLARISIDADAILAIGGQAPRLTMHTHTRILRAITDFGVIRWMGANDDAAMWSAVDQLSADQRTLWTKRLHDLYDSNRMLWGDRDETTHEIFAMETIPSDAARMVDLVVLSEEIALLRGVPATKGFKGRPNEPEFSLVDSVDVCTTIRRMQDLRTRGNFAAGKKRDDVWDQLFALPASLSSDVTVLDRYFLSDVLRANPPKVRDHAQWLLRKLAQSVQPNSTFRILCELPGGLSATDATERLRQRLAHSVDRGNFKSVEAVLAPWPTASASRPHNRHIRFSCGVAVATDEGFDRLDQSTLQYLEGFTWRVATDRDRIASWSKRERSVVTSLNRIQVPIIK